jgi:hypothetical protein
MGSENGESGQSRKKTKKELRQERREEQRVARATTAQRQVGRRRILGALGGITGLAALVSAGAFLSKSKEAPVEQQKEKNFKEKVLEFTWKDSKDKEKLNAFVATLGKEYLRLTQTTRLKEEDLLGVGKTNFFNKRAEFIEVLKHIDPPSTPLDSEWGVTNPSSKRVFIDLDSLERTNKEKGITLEAGTVLITALWHEWAHLDYTKRETGELINSPQYTITSNTTNLKEQFKSYQGGIIHSDTDYIFKRWDEVLVETITQRRIIEQVGINSIFTSANYDENGVNVLFPFTRSANISVDQLYQLHASSDVEGQAKLLGQSLPGNEQALQKGIRFMGGLNRADPVIISSFGLTPR